jgi:hypothetical protein
MAIVTKSTRAQRETRLGVRKSMTELITVSIQRKPIRMQKIIKIVLLSILKKKSFLFLTGAFICQFMVMVFGELILVR